MIVVTGFLITLRPQEYQLSLILGMHQIER